MGLHRFWLIASDVLLVQADSRTGIAPKGFPESIHGSGHYPMLDNLLPQRSPPTNDYAIIALNSLAVHISGSFDQRFPIFGFKIPGRLYL